MLKSSGSIEKNTYGAGRWGRTLWFSVILAAFYSVKHEEKSASRFLYQNLPSVCPLAKCSSGLQFQRSPGGIHTTTESGELCI